MSSWWIRGEGGIKQGSQRWYYMNATAHGLFFQLAFSGRNLPLFDDLET